MRERIVFPTDGVGDVVGQLDFHMQRNEAGPYLTPFMRIKFLIQRAETIRALEENMIMNLLHLGLRDCVLGVTPPKKHK